MTLEYHWKRTPSGSAAHLGADDARLLALLDVIRTRQGWRFLHHPHENDNYDLDRDAPDSMRRCLICSSWIEDVESLIDDLRYRWAEDQLTEEIHALVVAKAKDAPF